MPRRPRLHARELQDARRQAPPGPPLLPVDLPSEADLEAAAAFLDGHVHRTPLLTSRTLGERVGAPALLKAELLQRTGSFKVRGALWRVAKLTPHQRAAGVITVSAGNHAQAVALACAQTATEALVLMPRGASPAKVAAARGYGATVDLGSADAAEAFARMTEIAAGTGRVVLHPFDDPAVIAGQGTVGLEILEDDAGETEVIVVPVGGGGLLSGIVLAARARRPGTRIVAVQAANHATLEPALTAGSPVSAATSPTLADGLTAPAVGQRTIAACAGAPVSVVHVTEEELAQGVRFAHERAKLACEPAGAAGVAALLAGRVDFRGARGVTVVLTGGNAAGEVFARLLGLPGLA